ncbi:MAG: ABC transporter substrate-binding protein [Clostridiaceae bacterium]
MKTRSKMAKAMGMVLSAVLICAVFSGCGSKPAENDSSQSSVTTASTTPAQASSKPDSKNKLAFFFPLTGDLMQYGQSLKNGAELAVKHYNEKNGTNYVAEFNDDKGDPKEAVNLANKIAADSTVIAGLGSFTSSCAMAAAPVFEENKLLLLSPTASHTDFPSMGTMMFSCVMSQKYEGAEFANEVFKKFGAKKLAIIYQNTDQGVQASKLFADKWKELGGEMVALESYVPGQTKDFTPILSNVKTKNPDIIYASSAYSDAAQIFMQSKGLDINAQLIGPGMCLTEEFLKVIGNKADGAIILSSTPCFMPSVLESSNLDDSTKKFIEDYKAAYNKTPDGFSAQAFDTVNILLDSVSKVGTDSEALRKDIASIRDYAGLSGFNMKFNENKEMVKGIYVFQLKDGNFVRAN